MNAAGWNFAAYQAAAQEGELAVPGAALKYRLAGPASAREVVVFESGWSASLAYGVWLEQALIPQVRVLSYDRAGVGDSRSSAPVSAQAMTRQLFALLDSLGIGQPVIIAGHSYGGLIAALHAAQAPQRVKSIVQIDSTPEFDHPLIDPSFKSIPAIARFMQLCALLGIDGPIFINTAVELPPEIFVRIKRNRAWLLQSLSGSIAEIRLLAGIRQTLAAAAGAEQCPRLAISSTPERKRTWLQKLVISEDKAREYWDAASGLHQRQAARNAAGRWIGLPYNHVSLVTDRSAAQIVARHILDFIG